ncbi:MAG: UDP-N-acetylmuramoyl-L-alanyl-D-glutamate--2,6-diaminopimelate ligase [Proteobacteria bacterium]|nr:UDP-N-acetylmuramoyl-L-alanyl-D-glutamate--2,6-diaminopimelate ligase [Pseudomonadota bacterium]
MNVSSFERFVQSGLSALPNHQYDEFRQRLNKLGVVPLGLSNDSRSTQMGDLFFAYPGSNQDGRIHIAEAIKQGCSVVVWEQDGWIWNSNLKVPNLEWRNVRGLMGQFAANFFGDPTSDLHIFGVTGTNGKTSCANWLAEALFLLGRQSACIGTLGSRVLNKKVESGLHQVRTTPDAISMQRTFRELRAMGVSCVAIEASSHALTQNRLDGTKIDTALFTNLSHDHLDYHGTLENYAKAKAQLFMCSSVTHAVINIDDDFGMLLANTLRRHDKGVVTYSCLSAKADIHATNLKMSLQGSSFYVETLWGSRAIESSIIGAFNISNLLAVLGALVCSGESFDRVCDAIGGLKHPEGRLQRVGQGCDRFVYVDYAHTPDALRRVLSTLRALIRADARVITVFGAGGDRDKDKRPGMGDAVLEFSDIAILTTDNPRDETPEEICDQIICGREGQFIVELDRRVAISRAIELSNEVDVVLIAGKGHETFQEISGNKIPFSDHLVAEECLNTLWPRPNTLQDSLSV